MLELILSILLSLGLRFETNEKGQIVIDQNTADQVAASPEFQESGGTIYTDDVVINDDISPSACESDKE